MKACRNTRVNRLDPIHTRPFNLDPVETPYAIWLAEEELKIVSNYINGPSFTQNQTHVFVLHKV